jgi:NADH-quinone oxidoreductase subunit M
MALLMTDLNTIILSCLIFCPLMGAILVALLPRSVAREGAFVVAVINFVLSLHLWAHWNEAKSVLANSVSGKEFHFQQVLDLAPQMGIKYHLGVDGISVFLVLLTTFLAPIVLLLGWNSVGARVKEYAVCMLILESAVVGVFSALDLILFYIFWEAVLIPVYIQMVGWGGPRKAYAAGKFFVYTMLGSVFMWIAMIYLYFQQPTGPTAPRSFGYGPMYEAARALDGTSAGSVALILFSAFAIAFAIKAPIFPLHTWLPDAYSQAPTGTTVMLAAVLSKMGVYGFLRFAIPFFPNTTQQVAPLMIMLGAIGVIYGAIVAASQTDIKRLLAYSSVSHVALIIIGVFAAPLAGASGPIAASGATLQMVNHGLSTGALFLLAGLLFERRGTYDSAQYGGVASVMPRYTVLFWIALFASIGLPGLNGFVGEYLILQGAMNAGFLYAALGATGVVLGAIYMLRMFRTVGYGEITREENRALRDISPRETLGLGLILAVIVWIGVAPQRFLDIVNPDAASVALTAPVLQQQTDQLALR